MSLTPAPPPAPDAPEAPAVPMYRWYHKLFALIFIAFCLEIGIVLLVLPWSEYWDNNFFASMAPGWDHLWSNSYFRGAVSGLGMINILISVGELFRLRRFRG